MKMAAARKRLVKAQAEIDAVAEFFEDMGLDSTTKELDEVQDQIEQVLGTIEALQAAA